MKKLKSFWKYFTITILLLFALACAGVLYMFFVGAPLFNLQYISYNENCVSEEYSVVQKNITTVELNNSKYGVKILDSENDNIYLKIHNGVFGFTKKANSQFSLNKPSFDEETGVLTFVVSEPHGFVAAGSSEIRLYLPATARLNLVLSNSKAATVLNTSAQIENLSYTTQSGNLAINAGEVEGEMNLSLGSATFSMADQVATNDNVVNLKMTSGCFNCPNKDFSTINLISSTSGIVRCKSCEQMNGDNSNAGGSITISQLDNANLTAGDTNIKIETLTSGMIDIGKTGKIEIGKIVGRVNLHTDSGNITVGEVEFELSCTSQSGNILVDRAHRVVNAETGSSNISVNFDFAENAGAGPDNNYVTTNSYKQDKDNRRLIAKTASGNIYANGVENVDILITGNGHASINFENVLGNNIIRAQNRGSVSVVVKEFVNTVAPDGWSHFYLKTHGEGAVRVHFTQMDETFGKSLPDFEDEINPNAAHDEDKNRLTVETKTGSLLVLDSVTALI